MNIFRKIALLLSFGFVMLAGSLTYAQQLPLGADPVKQGRPNEAVDGFAQQNRNIVEQQNANELEKQKRFAPQQLQLVEPPVEVGEPEPPKAPVSIPPARVAIYGDTNGNDQLDKGERWQISSSNSRFEAIYKDDDGNIKIDVRHRKDKKISKNKLANLISGSTIKVGEDTVTLNTYLLDIREGEKFTVEVGGENYSILVDERGQLYRLSLSDKTVEKLNFNFNDIGFMVGQDILTALEELQGDGKVNKLKRDGISQETLLKELEKGNSVTIDSFNSRWSNDDPPSVRLLTKADFRLEFMKFLSDENSSLSQRASVMRSFGELYKDYPFGEAPVTESIITASRDKDSRVRYAAVEALKKIGDKRAIPALVAALGEEFNGNIRKIAREALKVFGKAAVEALIQGVKSENKDVRVESIKLLGEIGDPRAIPVLVEALGDWDLTDFGVLINARSVLKDFKDAAIGELIKGLKSKNEKVRAKSASLLGDMNAIEAVDELIKVVEEDRSYYVTYSAILALGTLRDVRALPIIVDLLGDPYTNFFSRTALFRFGEKAIPGLINGRKSSNFSVRKESIKFLRELLAYLGSMKVTSAVEPLIEIARADPDFSVRWAAVKALGEIGDRRAVESLVSLLNDPSGSLSALAALSLGTIGDKSAIKPLLDMVLANQGVKTSKLRWWAAVTALRQIKGEYQSATLKRTIEENVTVPVGGIIPPADFTVFSAGYIDGWEVTFANEGAEEWGLSAEGAEEWWLSAKIDVNSNTILGIQPDLKKDYLGRGYRIVVVNEKTGKIERMGHFDIWIDDSRRAAKLMADFIKEIPEGKIVLVGVIDEGSVNLTLEAIKAMESLGSTLINRIGFRNSFALIGRKGAEPGSAIEFLTPSGWGTVTVSTRADVARYYDADGNLIFTDVYPAPGVDLRPRRP